MTTPRTARRPRLNRRRLKAGLAALVLLAVAGGGAWLWYGGLIQRATAAATDLTVRISAHLGFEVAEVMVAGRVETAQPTLLAAVDAERGMPLLAFDAGAAKQRVEALPWVHRASVERILPDRVLVRVQERQPLAIWQHDGRFRLIDAGGTVIPERSLHRFRDLVLVVGPDAPDHAADLVRTLQTEPELMGRVRAAVRIDGRRWTVRLDNGMDIKLPAEDPAQAWGRLAAYQRTHRVLARDIATLDLRLPDRLILRRPAAPEPDPAPDGNDTAKTAPQGRPT